MNTKATKYSIKNILSKQVILYISLGINIVFLICGILGTISFDKKKMGYIGEWYGRARIIPASMMKAHQRKMTEHFKDLKKVLVQEEFNVQAFSLAVSNINEEKMLFNKEIESIMIEKFQKMNQKQREKFVDRIENKKAKKANVKKRNNKKKYAKKENKKRAEKAEAKSEDK